MQLIGQTVKHPVFGVGTVTETGDGTLTVCFREEKKMFIYPDAFTKFLVFQNAEMQGKILGAIKTRREKEKEQEQAELAKWEQEIALRNMKISTRSQAVFDIKPNDVENVFLQWKVSTGKYLSGYSKGEPRIPDRMKPNSMCILTERPTGAAENQRKIIGVYMTDQTFIGSECADGLIPAHPEYRLHLPKDKQPLFWPYLTEESAKQRWGNTSFKYIANTDGEKILRSFRGISDLAEVFYQYYCSINRLEPVENK